MRKGQTVRIIGVKDLRILPVFRCIAHRVIGGIVRRTVSGPVAIGHRGWISHRNINDDAAAGGGVDAKVHAEVFTGPVGSPPDGEATVWAR